MAFTAALQTVSPLYSLGLFSGAFVLYWIVWIIYARTLHPLSKVPGPWLATVSRTWYMLQIIRGDMEKTQRRLHEKYGPLIRIGPNEVACASPDAIKKIYRIKDALNKTDFYPVWSNNTFSKYPDNFTGILDKLHGERRRIVNHVYSLSNVLQSERYIDRCSEVFMQKMKEHTNKNEPFDLGTWVQWYAFDVIGELYFGRMFGFMEKSHDHEGWINALELLTPFLCVTGVGPTYLRPLILGSAIAVPGSLKALKAIDTVAHAARECVSKRFGEGAVQTEKRTDLLQQLYDIYQEKGEKVDFKMGEITQEAWVGLFAGSDTTAIAFRAVFYYLMKTPSAYNKVVAEIDEATEKGELTFPCKYSDAIKLPYLCACIKEAFRVHPSVGLTMARLAPAEGMELCGTYIPSGYRVGMNGAVVQFDKSIFGEDADQYRPDRWLEGDATNMEKHMLHFGYGTRTCIGKNISLAELHKLVPQVLRHFKIEMWDQNKEWETCNTWFVKQTGVEVRLTPRKEAVLA
ncbi:hypothetical protein DTO271D3_8144 [Paecilomyces variotii]|nr:hypothetical protein DTO169C6_757 [Paecilomyces variotii]KAJ9262671.1 hypothetical protein DTO195F2_3392 [Paecilomyces variotii]KAJ9273169.1 hypothetical protein DTO212C5_754 [Paecilomyces variotii]KAJ9286334.1 hypothetical protein DTO021C3_6044 [Paecilomyces variotii]KAJ9306974.1 hypothetical protein DTO217A2_3564 [Paecilomyces variotii]